MQSFTHLSSGIVFHESDTARDVNLLFLFGNLLLVLGRRNGAIPAAVVNHIFEPAKLKGISLKERSIAA